MKKIKMIALIIILVISMTNCKAASVLSDNSIASTQAGNLPSLTIVSNGVYMGSSGVDQEELQKWNTYMSDKYQTDVTLMAITDYNTLLENVKNESQAGVVSLYAKDIITLIDSGEILPLDDYLKDNIAWNALPKEYKSRFIYKNHIWAIPKNYNIEINVLSIRADWLNKVGKTIPTSTDELIDVGKAFIAKDANNDSQTNDYLMGGFGSYGVCSQVLAAYGVYLNNNCTVAYDPTQGCITDTLFKPEAKQALLALRAMYNDGLIDPKSYSDASTAYSQSYSGIYGTISNSFLGTMSIGAQWATANATKELGRELNLSNQNDLDYALNIYKALPPLSTNNPLTYTADQKGYVLTKGTKDPKATINFFVDMVFSSRQSFLDTFFGLPDSYQQLSNNVIKPKLQDEQTKILAPTPRIIDATNLMLGEDYILSLSSENINRFTKIKQKTTQTMKDYIDRYTLSNQLVQIPVLYQINSETYDDVYESLRAETIKLFNSVPEQSLSIDSILEQYRNNVKLICRVDDIIQEANRYLDLPYKPLN